MVLVVNDIGCNEGTKVDKWSLLGFLKSSFYSFRSDHLYRSEGTMFMIV